MMASNRTMVRKRTLVGADNRAGPCGTSADETEFSDCDDNEHITPGSRNNGFQWIFSKQTILIIIVSTTISLAAHFLMMMITSRTVIDRSSGNFVENKIPKLDEDNAYKFEIQQEIDNLKIEITQLKSDKYYSTSNGDARDIKISSLCEEIERIQKIITSDKENIENLRMELRESQTGPITADDSQGSKIASMNTIIEELQEKVTRVTEDMDKLKSFVSLEKPEEGGFFKTIKTFFVSSTEVHEMINELGMMTESLVNVEKMKLLERIATLEESLDEQINSKEKSFMDRINMLAGDLQQKIKEVESKTQIKVDEMERNTNNIKSNLDNHRETIGEIITVLVNKETLIVILIILAIGEVIIIIVICKALSPKGRGNFGNSKAETGEILWNSSNNILNKIRAQTLQNAICIVSFHRETQPAHKQLTHSLLEDDARFRNVVEIPYLVCRHKEIPNLPAARLYLVFVDFNERHIILEDPSKGLGDLRLTTVLAARKIGGDVAVVYVRDSGSRQLADIHLYNPELTSVQNHRELSVLNRKQRVFSIYDRFSQYQSRHLKTVIGSDIVIQ